MTTACPSAADLQALLDERLAPDSEPGVLAHVDTCRRCQEALEALTAGELPSAVLLTRETRVYTAPVPPPAARPDRIGPYRVGRELGHGGMGVVYLGTHTRLRREAAVKLIRAGASAQPEDVARFRREAEALAAVAHPNVVAVYDVGEQDGVPWLAMEYVPGGTLRARAGGQPLPPRTAAEVARGLARGAAAVHAAGVVHRDIKPANVLLAPAADGGPAVPKLTDFGLARGLVGAAVTVPGTVMGTPQYMAPEQATSAAVGPSADVYGVGAVLYEALTGVPPFNGTDQVAVLHQVVTREPVAVGRLQPAIPRDLQTICHKCLEKDPARRYPTAAALADDLDRYLAGRPIVARPVGVLEAGWRLARRNPVLAALLALLLVAVAGGAVGVGWGYYRAEAARGREAAARGLEAEHRERAELSLYYSRIALAQREWEQNDVARAEYLLDLCAPADGRPDRRGWEWHYLKRLCHADRLTVPAHRQAISGLAFSPNGEFLATSAGDRGYRNDPARVPGELTLWDGRTFRKVGDLVGHTGRVDGAAFNPPGDLLASVGADGTVRLWDVAGRRQLRAARLRNHPHWHGAAPAFAPGGATLAVPGIAQPGLAKNEWGPPEPNPCLVDAATLRRLPLLVPPHASVAGACAFNAAGDLAAFAGAPEREADTWVVVWDLRAGSELYRVAAGTFVAAFSGDRLAVAADDEVLVLDARSKQPRQTLRGHTGPVYGAAWSPDGTLLATCGSDQTVRVWDVASGRERRVFRGHRALVTAVAWHPDGRRLASGDADGVLKVWDADRDQRGPVLSANDDLRYLTFLPDGRLRAAHMHDGGGVLTWAPDRGPRPAARPIRLGSASDWPMRYVALSPDGRLVAGPSPTDAATAVVWDAETGAVVHTLPGHGFPLRCLTFSPDGRTLACAAGNRFAEGKALALWRLPDGRGEPARTDLPCERSVLSVCFSADGSKLVAGERGTYVGTEADGKWTDGHISVWDVATGTQSRRWPAHSGGVQDVALDRQGRLASAGRGADGRVKVWDAATGELLHDLRGPESLTCVTFHPDGTRLAAVGYAGTVQLWDPATGHEVLTLRATDRHLSEGKASDAHLVFSPDGTRLAVNNWTGIVRVWDARPAPDTDRP
jgi:WD40 repeat protein